MFAKCGEILIVMNIRFHLLNIGWDLDKNLLTKVNQGRKLTIETLNHKSYLE